MGYIVLVIGRMNEYKTTVALSKIIIVQFFYSIYRFVEVVSGTVSMQMNQTFPWS